MKFTYSSYQLFCKSSHFNNGQWWTWGANNKLITLYDHATAATTEGNKENTYPFL